MPDFMIIGILFALLIAWKIRDDELRQERAQLVVQERPSFRLVECDGQTQKLALYPIGSGAEIAI
jgi:hypothetical protein